MFFWTYLRRELRRRGGRTILTALGLGVGVGLVAAITGLSNGLNEAQATVLDPLASVGTDLVVTRPIATQPTGFGGRQQQRPPDGRTFGELSSDEQQTLLRETQALETDLSKLGRPGDRFVHDFFLPAQQLTFPASHAEEVADLPGVAAVSKALTLQVTHQEGTVPKIVAEFRTEGEHVTVDEPITPPTEEEIDEIRECFARGGNRRTCLPARFRRFTRTFVTSPRVFRQVIDPPQTDIRSEQYTAAGVDLSTPGMGIITPSQVTAGKFFSAKPKRKEGVLADAYAKRKNLEVGSTLDINGTRFVVVGLAKPPLGGQAADVYLPLADLQKLAGREGRANVLLVRARDAGGVNALAEAIEDAFPGSTVTSAEDVAERVSGSLVDAAKLADRMGVALSVVSLVAAVLIASLLTLASVAKRVRELGTLKAIGWSQRSVVRQVVGESLAQGGLGGLAGAAIGVVAAVAIAALSPPLRATAAAQSPGGLFGLGRVAAPTTAQVPLQAGMDAGVVLLAIGLAILGGLLAGAAGALRTARLRPADALRDVG